MRAWVCARACLCVYKSPNAGYASAKRACCVVVWCVLFAAWRTYLVQPGVLSMRVASKRKAEVAAHVPDALATPTGWSLAQSGASWQ